MKVTVHTDGASRPHTDNLGGYAAVLEWNGKRKAVAGSAQNTTNNRMELMGALAAFRAIKKFIGQKCDVHVTSDSEYVVLGMSKRVRGWQATGWRTAAKKPVKNQDLWIDLVHAASRHKVTWTWTRGHADCEENNLADKLANEAIEKLRKKLGTAQGDCDE